MTDFQSTKQALLKSEAEFKALADNAPIMIVRVNREGIIGYINQVQLGYKIEDVIGTPVFNFIHPSHHDLYRGNIHKAIETAESVFFELKVPDPEGKIYWFDVHMAPIIEAEGIDEVVVLTSDVTEKKKAKEEMEKVLAEKEILLKEVHHRAKNNLQLLSSILNLFTNKTVDEKRLGVLYECKNSIHSLALVHECLYKSDDFSNIDFSDYLERFTGHFQDTVQERNRINLKLDLNPCYISMDKAITCGLIVNELLINSYKHAFPDNSKGTVTISLDVKDGRFDLMVKDDGVGFSGKDELPEIDSLGLELTGILVDQLNGEIVCTTSPNEGTSYTLQFGQSEENIDR
jgi:PAS domain S-box-containing protein